MTEHSNIIAVKRDGPRGWHWIARANYDPAVHVLHKLDPLDHDADGRKGGSLPETDHVHVPADYEVDGREPPTKTEPRVAPARKSRAKKGSV